MSIPLIITDANGNLLYSSRSVKISGVLHMWLSAISKSHDSGIVYYDGAAIFTKQFLLGGKRYRLFIDSDSAVCLGETLDRIKDGLFELSAYKNSKCINVSLRALTDMFVRTYYEELHDNGVRLSVRGLDSDVTVCVSPSVFAFCLSLMVRICANNASVITLSFTRECGRVVIFVDSVGGVALCGEPHEVLRAMLYEVSASVGFAVEERVRNGKIEMSLSLTPLDIALLGLKTEPVTKYKKSFEGYISIFL